jgi:methanethiol S-methyltransferase
MSRALILVYGIASYTLFLGVFLYLLAFIWGLPVPKTVNSGTPGPVAGAVLVNVVLLALFGVQHSVMARPSFKRWLTAWLPQAAERSTYVMATNLVLIVLYASWQPLPGVVWSVSSEPLAAVLWGVNVVGWLLVLVATFLTNHFDLFGLRQVWLNAARKAYTPVAFKEYFLYRWIRHPMMLGLLIALWVTPQMSVSLLMFSAGMTAYIFIGVHFEERGLRAELGETYTQYQTRTGRFLPKLS